MSIKTIKCLRKNWCHGNLYALLNYTNLTVPLFYLHRHFDTTDLDYH